MTDAVRILIALACLGMALAAFALFVVVTLRLVRAPPASFPPVPAGAAAFAWMMARSFETMRRVFPPFFCLIGALGFMGFALLAILDPAPTGP